MSWALQPHANGGRKGTEGVCFKPGEKNSGTELLTHLESWIEPTGVGMEDNLSLLRDQVGTCTLHFSLGWDQ